MANTPSGVSSTVQSGTFPQQHEALSSVKLKNRHYFRDKVKGYQEAHKESVAKWNKDHPTQEPGTSTRTWKSFSRVKYTSEAYRAGWDQINWGGPYGR